MEWTEEDWYQNNIEGGMTEADARLAVAQEMSELDIDDQRIIY